MRNRVNARFLQGAWLGSLTVTCRTCNSEVTRGRRFDSAPGHVLPASCSHTCASVTKQYNLVPVKGRWCPEAGKVTVGLASHWPCVTNLSGLSTCGLNGQRMEDEHPAYALDGARPGLPFTGRQNSLPCRCPSVCVCVFVFVCPSHKRCKIGSRNLERF